MIIASEVQHLLFVPFRHNIPLCLTSLQSDYSKLLKGFKRRYAQFFSAGRPEKVKMNKIVTTTLKK